jgi:hypothetical protein
MIPDGWPDVTRVAWCGARGHLVRCWIGPNGWRVEMDPPACGEPEAVLQALAGAGPSSPTCDALVSVVSWLLRRGLDPGEAIQWAATGVVDPQRRVTEYLRRDDGTLMPVGGFLKKKEIIGRCTECGLTYDVDRGVPVTMDAFDCNACGGYVEVIEVDA